MTLGSHQSRGVLLCVLSKQMPGAASRMIAISFLCDNYHQPAQPLQMVVISLPKCHLAIQEVIAGAMTQAGDGPATMFSRAWEGVTGLRLPGWGFVNVSLVS